MYHYLHMLHHLKLAQELDPRDAIHRIVEALSCGRLVILPTETGYVVTALSINSTGINKLASMIQQFQEKHSQFTGRQFITLMMGHKKEALDYWITDNQLSTKLISRCWPGPLMFVIDQHSRMHKTSLISTLCGEHLCDFIKDHHLLIGCSSHEVWSLLRRLLSAPLLAWWPGISDSFSTDTPSVLESAALITMLNLAEGILVDDGPTRFQQFPSIVEFIPSSDPHSHSLKIQLSGVLTETSIRRMAGEFILFVCTGNTCRSPMAEGIFRHMLAQELCCRTDDLIDHGYMITSAGLAAMDGDVASPEAVKYLSEKSIDISTHSSKSVTHELLEQADQIYTMTKGHRNSILSQRPDLVDKVHLLSPYQRDIADPIGGDTDVYAECAREIEDSIKPIIQKLLTPGI